MVAQFPVDPTLQASKVADRVFPIVAVIPTSSHGHRAMDDRALKILVAP